MPYKQKATKKKKETKTKQNKRKKKTNKQKKWSCCKEFKLYRLARLPIGEKGKTDAYE